MADLQTINVGNLVNDGLGDDLRTAFQKVNANFADLNAELTVTVVNTGTTGEGVFKQKVGAELQFKSLVAGNKIVLGGGSDSITINNSAPDAFIRYDTDAGTISASTKQQIYMQGTSAPNSETGIKDIEVTTDGTNGLLFKTIIPVTEYLTTYDYGYINSTFDNALQFAFNVSNSDFGTITLASDVELDCGGLT